MLANCGACPLHTHTSQGECIWEQWSSDVPVPGMFIVLSGVVRAQVLVEGTLMPTYLGAGAQLLLGRIGACASVVWATVLQTQRCCGQMTVDCWGA